MNESYPSTMRFTILLPTRVYLQEEIQKLVIEAPNGSFCMKPRHIDFVSAVTPGILSYLDTHEQPNYIAHHEGMIVKCHREVTLCCLDAVGDAPLDTLHQMIEQRFRTHSEQEKKMHTILAHFEIEFARKLHRLGQLQS